MRYMHWSWEDYTNAPLSLIEAVMDMMEDEYQRRKHEAARAKSRSSSGAGPRRARARGAR